MTWSGASGPGPSGGSPTGKAAVAEPKVEANCWRARPALAAAVAVAIVAVPVLVSIAVAGVLGYLWPTPASTAGVVGRWLTILGTSTIVFFGFEHLTRRALPLSVLLKMGMVFPGRAPRRLSVAMRSWTTRDLSRRIDEARDQGIADEPIVAAQKIVTLAATLNAHDRKTRGHAERVRAYTDLIAEELRLPDEDRDRLRWSALLHDVGKLTVHSDILNKPDVLSDEEWEVMRRHPLEGAKLTAPLAAWLGPWAATIEQHHERFDGRGYPYGLAGREISLGGRIVTVADCFDTMTSARSYNKPMSTEAARAELTNCAGDQFDPVIVRAFLAVSVSRLRAVAPLTWIGSLPFGNLGPQLARFAAVGRVGIMTLAATVGVVSLAAQKSGSNSNPTYVAKQLARPAASLNGAPSGGGNGPAGSGTGPVGPGHTEPGKTQAEKAGGGAQGSGSGDFTGGIGEGTADPGGGDGSSTGSGLLAGGESTTTTRQSGSPPTTVITSGGTTTTTTPTAPTTTTATTTTTAATTTTTPVTPTTAPPTPPSAPTNLSATGSCQVLVVGPEVTLSWKASTSTTVTGYSILRSTSKTSGYSAVGSVTGRTSVSYTDTSVSGLGKTYWYEVKALAGSLSATSSPASASTPTLCL